MGLTLVARNIRTVIRTLLGMDENAVRRANQKSPATSTTLFASVLVSPAGTLGWDTLHAVNEPAPSENIEETVLGMREVTASVQFFNAGALDMATLLNHRLQHSDGIALMQSLGLGLVASSTVQDLTGVVDADYEERARIELHFYAVSKDSESIETYGTFPISINNGSTTTSNEVSEL